MLTDRSRIIAHQTCPRQRYLAYHIHGTGLQRRAKALPLVFGGAFHVGCHSLLKGAIEGAVADSYFFLKEQFDKSAVTFEGEIPADAEKALEYGQEEQVALAEALLRGWWAFEGPAFLDNFEVIEVEREGRAELVKGWEQPNELVLMFRPDALVRDKMSGDIYVVSWKTCATFTKRTVDQARHDMQSMSEVWGIQEDTEQNIGDMLKEPFKIEGVLYKFIVKGRRTKDDFDGLYKQDSHLIYGWRKLRPGDDDIDEWSWSYKWKDDEINPKTGKPIGHTLGKGWQKVPIWRDYPGGVARWIEDLAAHRIFPRHMDALQEVFPQAMPVERRADEVESWKRQTIAQEREINSKLEHLRTWDLSEGPPPHDLLDEFFPQYTHSCHSYSGCPFIPVCWEGAKAEVGELYQIREANHPEKGNGDE